MVTADISMRTREEQARAVSDGRFRAFVDHAPDAMFLFASDASIVDVNQRACVSLGYTREELVGLTPFDYDADVTPERLEFVTRRLDRGVLVQLESRYRRKDGSIFPVEVRMQTFELDGQRNGIAMVRDLTARKQLQRQVAELEEQLREAERVVCMAAARRPAAVSRARRHRYRRAR